MRFAFRLKETGTYGLYSVFLEKFPEGLLKMIRVFEENCVPSVKYFHTVVREKLKGRPRSFKGNHEVILGPGKQYETLDLRKDRVEIFLWPAEASPRMLRYRAVS
jgi:hypothetical protein